MNYLAHLYFAQPTPDSHFGNLLGDFRRGVDVNALSVNVQKGLETHYLVDKFTDAHQAVKDSINLFTPTHRRFAPVALDILYDHFLSNSWQAHNEKDISSFRSQSYDLLASRLSIMPTRMQSVIGHMVNNDGLSVYSSFEGVARSIYHVASRIRFKNNFHTCVEDIEREYEKLYSRFEAFFPELIEHVEKHNSELKQK